MTFADVMILNFDDGEVTFGSKSNDLKFSAGGPNKICPYPMVGLFENLEFA